MKTPMYVRAMSPGEHEKIEAGLRSSDAFTLRRSQILLASSREQRPKEIASNLGCATQTVRNAIHAFEVDPVLATWDIRHFLPTDVPCSQHR